MAVQTKALAAYVQSRNLKFAGGPVTLSRLAQMWGMPFDAAREVVDAAILEGVARYLKMTVSELTAVIPRPAPLSAPPIVRPAPAPIQIPSVPAPAPAPAPAPTPIPVAPEPTAVIPKDQLTDLVAASRKSEPVIEVPAPTPADDPAIDISFEDVEATPVPERDTPAATPSAKAKKKSKKKKS